MPQQQIISNTDYLLDRINQIDQRLRQTENHNRIQNDMALLKKQEQENLKAIKESQYEELVNRHQTLEKRLNSVEQQINKHDIIITQTTPQQISKSLDKALNHMDKLREEIEDQFTAVQNKSTKQYLDFKVSLDQQLAHLKNTQENKYQSISKENEKQLHEVLSMVEDMARIVKNLELQFNNKRPETESILLNIANIQRKMDENQRLALSELTQLKQRQYKLFNLYNTGLENNNVLNNQFLNSDTQKLSMAELEPINDNFMHRENNKFNQVIMLESTGKFKQSQTNSLGKENYIVNTLNYHKNEKRELDSFGYGDLTNQ
ncbi:UNKNOWN [Stylonychia lemnae]|uniref:Uncharacterized protein n=1 Tax=Stylonychia lemnae TaxID=5949 RepID=A0A078AHP1_STYLE|nr:UNKNOWN [Stylonychia lemnae]|eukprot:CDW81017.1 UNKNOWN [Stylonychia lemnae]